DVVEAGGQSIRHVGPLTPQSLYRAFTYPDAVAGGAGVTGTAIATPPPGAAALDPMDDGRPAGGHGGGGRRGRPKPAPRPGGGPPGPSPRGLAPALGSATGWCIAAATRRGRRCPAPR